MSGDSKTNTTTSSSEPWAPYAKEMQSLWGQAKEADFPDPYNGTTFAGPNSWQTGAWSSIANSARRGNPMLPGLLRTANANITGGGLSKEQRKSLIPLQSYASGNKVGANNEYLMENLNRAASEAGSATDAMFSAGGRYGGGAHQGVRGETTGRIFSEGMGAQMNADMDRQLAAQGLLQGVYGQGQDRALSWGAMAPGINEMRYGDAAKLAQVGDLKQLQSQAGIDDKVANYNADEAYQTEKLNWLASIISGGAPYSTTQQTTPRGRMASGILGGAATAGGILGGMGSGGAAWAPYALGAGGLLGAFM